jgi:hypothetical protein
MDPLSVTQHNARLEYLLGTNTLAYWVH